MLTTSQLAQFAKTAKISENVVMREFLQTLFLKELYEEKYSAHIFFKGGTAIRLLLSGTRFSEDLDFSVSSDILDFEQFIVRFFQKLEKLYDFSFKKRNSITGSTYLLTAPGRGIDTDIFISLDFSFREQVLQPAKSVINTQYPVVFTSFVHHLSPEEILAEKVRAILTREKGRDIYDLWFLLSSNVVIDGELATAKLRYYDIPEFEPAQLLARVTDFSREKFILDVRPFVPINEREKLADFFDYTVAFLKQKIASA